MDELGRVGPEDYTTALKLRIVVVLDDVRSRHNVGSIFRSADCFGVERIELCGFTPLPPHREIEKTALGATRSVPWVHVEAAADAVRALQAAGYKVFAVEQTLGAIPLNELGPVGEDPIALVFGNELNGVSEAVVVACDQCVVIPQHGSKHSLNVSVCAGVVLHHLAGNQPGRGNQNAFHGST
ncbi:MAG: RNA methyltransferase [Flavobacteriales bacterium]|nr:RNA methyltransferase [Flavobacteriales bacterium]